MRDFSYSLKQETNKYKFLDACSIDIKFWPARINTIEIDYVFYEIYKALQNFISELTLYGAK